MPRKLLLIAGIVAPLLYIATDAVAAWQWAGYSYLHQTVSETFAIGTPTRPLIVGRGFIYVTLIIAFGAGVLQQAKNRRSLQVIGWLLIVLGLVDSLGAFAPMHVRGAERTLTDTLHIASASVDVVFILTMVGIGTAALGKSFRLYSIFTFVVVVVFGTLAGIQGPRIATNDPTPWIGLTERIGIFAFMVWMLVLALLLLTQDHSRLGARH